MVLTTVSDATLIVNAAEAKVSEESSKEEIGTESPEGSEDETNSADGNGESDKSDNGDNTSNEDSDEGSNESGDDNSDETGSEETESEDSEDNGSADGDSDASEEDENTSEDDELTDEESEEAEGEEETADDEDIESEEADDEESLEDKEEIEEIEIIDETDDTAAEDNFYWSDNQITGYKGASASVYIPARATSIAATAFNGNHAITSINMSDSNITTIYSGSFGDCNQLTSVQFPATLTSIEAYAFLNCTRLTSIDFPYEDGKQKSNLKSIGVSAFGNVGSGSSSGLELCNLPNSLETIGETAFSGAKLKGMLVLPIGLTSIGKNAFKDCSNIGSLEVQTTKLNPASGDYIFVGTTFT